MKYTFDDAGTGLLPFGAFMGGLGFGMLVSAIDPLQKLTGLIFVGAGVYIIFKVKK